MDPKHCSSIWLLSTQWPLRVYCTASTSQSSLINTLVSCMLYLLCILFLLSTLALSHSTRHPNRSSPLHIKSPSQLSSSTSLEAASDVPNFLSPHHCCQPQNSPLIILVLLRVRQCLFIHLSFLGGPQHHQFHFRHYSKPKFTNYINNPEPVSQEISGWKLSWKLEASQQT